MKSKEQPIVNTWPKKRKSKIPFFWDSETVRFFALCHCVLELSKEDEPSPPKNCDGEKTCFFHWRKFLEKYEAKNENQKAE